MSPGYKLLALVFFVSLLDGLLSVARFVATAGDGLLLIIVFGASLENIFSVDSIFGELADFDISDAGDQAPLER